MIDTETIKHKHKDGRWVKEHTDQLGGITYTSNFDHERMLWESKLRDYYGSDDIQHWGNLGNYYKKYATRLYQAEINMLYEQWQDYVQEGHTMAGFDQWLEWECYDHDTIREARLEIEEDDDLYDGITEVLDMEGFN